MRDEHEGDAEPGLEMLQLELHALAQLEVERTERLVEEEYPRPVDDGAGQATRCCWPPDNSAG